MQIKVASSETVTQLSIFMIIQFTIIIIIIIIIIYYYYWYCYHHHRYTYCVDEADASFWSCWVACVLFLAIEIEIRVLHL